MIRGGKKKSVMQAFSEFKPMKAPGPDGVTPVNAVLLSHLPELTLTFIVFLMRASMQLAYVPDSLCKSNIN